MQGKAHTNTSAKSLFLTKHINEISYFLIKILFSVLQHIFMTILYFLHQKTQVHKSVIDNSVSEHEKLQGCILASFYLTDPEQRIQGTYRFS